MTDVPVFLITGFLESGKTTFIKEIFNDPEFYDGEKILLIVCENGVEEYEVEFLKKHNANIVSISNIEEFTELALKEFNQKYKPTKVVLEYNGMWQFDIFDNMKFPDRWEIAQIITTIDASTFESYMSNMKSLLIEQFKNSDLIIFNRCNDKTNKLKFRNSVKAINSRANMMFELENGEIDDSPLELPFDIHKKVIEFKDYDYGVWYLDATEYPEKYDGKNIKVKGLAYSNPKYPKGVFAFGRNAMTCCEDDISFLGILCQTSKIFNFKDKEWIELEGIIHKKYIQQEQREIPYIVVQDYKKIDKLEEELVYF